MERQMTRDDFLMRFNKLNAQIEAAVASQDFARVTRVDEERRQMLQDFAANSVPDGDKELFDVLERCAAANARAITEMDHQMKAMRRTANHKVRSLAGYGHREARRD